MPRAITQLPHLHLQLLVAASALDSRNQALNFQARCPAETRLLTRTPWLRIRTSRSWCSMSCDRCRLVSRHWWWSMQAVWTEYRRSDKGLKFEEPAAWAAFQGLQAQGMLTREGQKRGMRLPAKRCPVRLAATPDDVRQGVAASETGTGDLRDALGGVGGVGRAEASAV
jgi:hypothetical protein